MSMNDGHRPDQPAGGQPAGLVVPTMPTPPRGEPLQQSIAQVTMEDGSLVIVLTYVGPGRTWQGVIEGTDAVRWGQQMQRIGELTAAGLVMPQ